MAERIIEDYPYAQVVEVGGRVHYSIEFQVYLLSLPFEQRQRIVNEIEERASVRRFVRYKQPHQFTSLQPCKQEVQK